MPPSRAPLEAAGRSFRQAGFTHIVLLGDHGGYQSAAEAGGRRPEPGMGRHAACAPISSPSITARRRRAYVQALRAKGLSDAQIGEHAGAADTSLDAGDRSRLVRADRLRAVTARPTARRATRAPSSAALGQLGVDLIVSQTVAAIRKARAEKH